jgi:ABC-type multidrug transport system fused ATPase/permease subunit
MGILGAIVNGSIWPFFNIAFSNILSLMIDAAEHESEIDNYCLLFLATAVGGAICTFLYKFPFDVYGQGVVYEVRKEVFDKLLRLPVSFYDKKENTPGAISTKLASDAYQLNNMISGVCAVMCMNLSTVSISLIFAFTNSWQLTLIVLGLSPLIMISGAINMAVLKGLATKSE